MIFTVAYRNTSGEKEYIVVEAESRHMLFEKLKEQQITPIQIFSGNQQYKLLKKSDKSNYTFKVIFMSLCAIVTVSLVSIVSINPDLFIKKEKTNLPKKTIIKSSNRNYISDREEDRKRRFREAPAYLRQELRYAPSRISDELYSASRYRASYRYARIFCAILL